MPITAADLKFFASAKMTDAADAGGARGSTVVQDGAAGNVFPDVTAQDRLSGSARLRKVYPSAVNADNKALLSAFVDINEGPSDALISGLLVSFGGVATTRAEVEAAIKANALAIAVVAGSYTFQGGQAVQVTGTGTQPPTPLQPGVVMAFTAFATNVTTLHMVLARAANGSGGTDLTLDTAIPGSGSVAGEIRTVAAGSLRLFGSVVTSASASAGASTLALARLWDQAVPVDLAAAYPTAELSTGIGSAWARYTHGRALVIGVGDGITISDEQAMAPATVSNSQTVNTGRTNLTQLTVVGNDGVVIARFLKDGPTPTGVGCTANLAAGTVTFSSVTGYSQPVTVRHRISEESVIQSLTALTATLAAPLANAYPSGARVTSHVRLGDLQPDTSSVFSQQAWTRVWSDAVIGNAVGALYQGAIEVTGDGAETDRWAVVFTSSTQFYVLSERLGQIAQGNTGSDFAPLNPATNQPYFTLASSGWQAPAVGNVLRFNTTGAYAPLWALRCVRPGAASGTDRVTLRLRGGAGA